MRDIDSRELKCYTEIVADLVIDVAVPSVNADRGLRRSSASRERGTRNSITFENLFDC